MKFAELTLHPALAKALAGRGYETATGVQAAVLDRAVVGKDLLVSSQTGSGKTIAFGAALAETLLDGERGEAAPAALVIVPTRELAAQVRAELSWLFAGTGLRLAAFTGGTPVGGDLRALERGVDVAIGTPGRLVDLLRRERLALGGLKVVVLDEADEMLDLGFREDLEIILQAAPVERRTLLLSATLPPEIRAMARRFQRDAVPIDPRRAEGRPVAAAAHEDIAYVAHLIARDDRLAAVVNVLRASESARAIVFCTTREGVAGLHAALVARGFAATAISGERAQAERDRALDRLRRGEVRILVATNVAARGLHLPDVDLIVHADLPLNAESLTHRSGRTGRAGRKGTAVVLATPFERRKAERLLSSAHVKPVWTPPPSREAIAAAARDRLAVEILETTDTAEASTLDAEADVLARRLETSGASTETLLRRLLARELARLPGGEAIQPVAAPSGRDEGPPPPRNRAELSRGAVLFRVNLGAKDNADPRWLLPLICRRGGVTRRDVGAIRIGPRETTFEISGRAALEFADAAAESDPRAPHVLVERADAPSRGPSPMPARKPRLEIPPPIIQPPAIKAPVPKPPTSKPPAQTGHAPAPHGGERPLKRRDGFAPYAPGRDRRPVSSHPHAKPHPQASPQHPHAKPHHPHAKPHHPHAKPHAAAPHGRKHKPKAK
jgi:ATP-dependent RNA helicase DeaD